MSAQTPAQNPFEFTSGSVEGAPRSDDQSLLDHLNADLQAADFTVDGVHSLLGSEAYAALDRDQLVPARIALEDATADGVAALATLIRFWLLAETLPAGVVSSAFPSLTLPGLLSLGLAEEVHDGVRAATDLRPYAFDGPDGVDRELWVTSDLGAHQRPGVLRRDHVLGIGQASTTLAQITVRRPVLNALDLGTGCGIQAFHLLSHARHVVATDISERALAFTRFNLLLNARALDLDPAHLGDRVSLRLGSLLEPVRNERFDQVVSNPPFVITPRHTGESAEDQFTYRDGGLPGDEIVSTLIRTLPSVLVEGGLAQMLGNWEVTEGGEWDERPRSWVPDEAEAWLVQRELLTPAHYAETWLRDASEGRDPALYTTTYRDYLSDFASRQVAGIGFGMVVLRRRKPGSSRLMRFEEITYPVEQPLGAHFAAGLDREDWLAAHVINDALLTAAEDVTEERHQRPGALHPGVILLRQGAGFRRTNLLSSELAGFVSAADGEFSVEQLAAAVVSLTEAPEGLSAEQRTSVLMDEVAVLYRDGFLEHLNGK